MASNQVANPVAVNSPGAPIPNGVVRMISGKRCIYYDGYWIRHYDVPEDEDAARRELIEHLTKRVFHHTEPGINTPGYKLDEARKAYEREQDPEKKRVNAAMLAGALLNRGSDIFTSIFELRQKGIEIAPDNELLLECERCFLEAFEYGAQVLHYSGEEGLDELWGEPLKVFSMPIAEFYESRYIKIAQTMSAIDRISDKLIETFQPLHAFDGLADKIRAYAVAAKSESETMKTDPAIFEVWPAFVTSGDKVFMFQPVFGQNREENETILEGLELVRRGKKLIEWSAFARVPMPKTTKNLLADCSRYAERIESFKAA